MPNILRYYMTLFGEHSKFLKFSLNSRIKEYHENQDLSKVFVVGLVRYHSLPTNNFEVNISMQYKAMDLTTCSYNKLLFLENLAVS